MRYKMSGCEIAGKAVTIFRMTMSGMQRSLTDCRPAVSGKTNTIGMHQTDRKDDRQINDEEEYLEFMSNIRFH